MCWDASRDKWTANITIRGAQKFLGRFASAEDAAKAYDREAVAQFSEFAALNFPAVRTIGN